MNNYQAFGLTIESEFILEEFLPGSGGLPDLTITAGKIPKEIKNPVINTESVKISKNRFWMVVKGIGGFYVEKGRKIVVEPYEGSSFEEVKLYLFGSCIGAALFQKRILPLHGSCINVKGKGILLTGDSGAGKSTVSAVICKQGYTMLSDDVSVVITEEGKEPIVSPSFPYQKLWGDAIERVDIRNERKALNRISENIYKYAIQNDTHFEEEPVTLAVVIEIIPSLNEGLEITEITGGEKLDVILKNTYRKIMAEAMDLKEWHFRECIKIAEHVQVFRIHRAKYRHLEQEIAKLILEKIG